MLLRVADATLGDGDVTCLVQQSVATKHKTRFIRARGRLNKAAHFVNKMRPPPDIDYNGLLDTDEDEETRLEHDRLGDKTFMARAKQWQHFAAHLSKEKHILMEQVENLTAELHQTSTQLQNANKQLHASSSENENLWDKTETAAELIKEKQHLTNMITKLSNENRMLKHHELMHETAATDCEQEMQRLSDQVEKLSQDKHSLYWKLRGLTG